MRAAVTWREDAMEMVVDDSFRIYEDDDMFMQLDDGTVHVLLHVNHFDF